MTNERVLVSINLGNFGSTGGIMYGIADSARECGFSTYQFFPRDSKEKAFRESDRIICSDLTKRIYQRICRYLGFNGCSAWFATKRMLRKIKKMNPTVIQLHNLHNSYINLPMLFRYFKKSRVPVVWTLHDCWPFTGQCPHFTYVQCEGWKSGCGCCPQYKNYPEMAFDNTALMFRLKKKWFCDVPNLTIIATSHWIEGLAKQSFLKEYPITVIHNGIDLTVFHPIVSDFRDRYSIAEDVTLLLATAFGWSAKKGLDILVDLAKRLPEDYRLVIVGTDDRVDEVLPDSVISIHRTQDQRELAEIYTAADFFVNPTLEDTYPTVNMEAIACGTPVITFSSCGSPESLDDRSGVVVEERTADALLEAVRQAKENGTLSAEGCLERAVDFEKQKIFKRYIDLYEKVIKN